MKTIFFVVLVGLSASFFRNDFFPILINPINFLPDVTNSPVFGVLNLKSSYTLKDYPNATHYIQSSYVKFLEMSGAQVVPIKLTDNYEEIDKILKMVNGVLFTGGDNPF